MIISSYISFLLVCVCLTFHFLNFRLFVFTYLRNYIHVSLSVCVILNILTSLNHGIISLASNVITNIFGLNLPFYYFSKFLYILHYFYSELLDPFKFIIFSVLHVLFIRLSVIYSFIILLVVTLDITTSIIKV